MHQIGHVLASLSGGGTGSIVGVILLLVAAALIVVVMTRYSRTLRGDPSRPPAFEVFTKRPARDWLAEAAEHERRGEWRDAVRCRYRALLSELDGRGVITEVVGTTSGEYRSAVARQDPQLASPFAGASELFERAWYGHLPGGPEDADRFRELADEVLTAAARE